MLGYSIAVYDTVNQEWVLYGYNASTTQKTTKTECIQFTTCFRSYRRINPHSNTTTT